MTRVIPLIIGLVFFLACQKTEQPSPKPNVILILTDDQGWGDLSLTGNPDLQTPNIDQLAQRGIHFTRFFVSAVCSPTRAEILTGRYAARGGVYSTGAGGERLDLDETTIAEVFKANGYRTAAYGKWHNGMQYPYHPNGRGFDDFYGFCSGHWGNYFSPMLERNGAITKGEGYLPDDLTNKAIEFISDSEDPFFLYIPYNTPHSPMQVPDDAWAKWENVSFSSDNDFREREKIDHSRAAYAMVENIDFNVGRIMDTLENTGNLDNTIVMFLTDNGPNGWRWNGNMKGIKGHVDEGGVRTPFLIQWPAQLRAGVEIDNISSAMDILPTLVDLLDLSYNFEKSLDGISLEPLLIGVEKTIDRTIINHWGTRTSVRTNQYRLGYDDQLFDMAKDPLQRMDISSQQTEVFEELVQLRQAWKDTVLVELPEKDERSFPVGHPDYQFAQLPARDAQYTNGIQRSNRWPNCSFLTEWTSTEDSIYFDIEVLQAGSYQVELYYTCSEANVGSSYQLSVPGDSLVTTIDIAHDSPLFGEEKDRFERIESYVKDFRPLQLGTLNLRRGQQNLVLKATDQMGDGLIDFRLLMLKRVN